MASKIVLPLLLLTSVLNGVIAGLSAEEQIKIASNDELLERKLVDHMMKPVRVSDHVTNLKHPNGKYVAPTGIATKMHPDVLTKDAVPSLIKSKAKMIKANNVVGHILEVKQDKVKPKVKKMKKDVSKKEKKSRKKYRKALKALKKKAKKNAGKLQKGKGKKQLRLLKKPSKKWKKGTVSKLLKKLKNWRNWRKGRKSPRRRLRLLKWRKRKGKPKKKIIKGKKGAQINALNSVNGKPGFNLSKGNKGKENIKGNLGQQNSKVKKGRKGKPKKVKSKRKLRNLKPGKKTKRKRKIGRANALKSVLRYLQRRNKKRKMPTKYLRRLIGIPSKKFKGKIDLKKINLKDLIKKHANKIPIAKAKNLERKIKNIIKNSKPIKENMKKANFPQKMIDIGVSKIEHVLAKPGVKKVLPES